MNPYLSAILIGLVCGAFSPVIVLGGQALYWKIKRVQIEHRDRRDQIK